MSERRPRWHAWLEWGIRGAALGTTLTIVLVLGFIGREALPLLWDHGARGELALRDLFLARAWPGYAEPVHVWQPVGPIPKHDVVPLLVGTLEITILGMMVAAPLGIGSAIWVACYAPPRVREVVKPAIEMLAAVPSVVIGLFALVVIADAVHEVFGFTYRLNAVVASLGLSLTVVPVIFTITEDALRAVPRRHAEAALALGARRYQVALRVLVPAAGPGIVAALVLGFGRAVGETMIVLMASGNAAVVDLLDPGTSARTITATIAAELGEVPRGETHWRVLFGLGLLLLLATSTLNLLGRRLARSLVHRHPS